MKCQVAKYIRPKDIRPNDFRLITRLLQSKMNSYMKRASDF